MSSRTWVARCSCWRRGNTLAGTPGPTATGVTASCPSGQSAWWVSVCQPAFSFLPRWLYLRDCPWCRHARRVSWVTCTVLVPGRCGCPVCPHSSTLTSLYIWACKNGKWTGRLFTSENVLSVWTEVWLDRRDIDPPWTKLTLKPDSEFVPNRILRTTRSACSNAQILRVVRWRCVMRTFQACGLTVSRTVSPAFRWPEERKSSPSSCIQSWPERQKEGKSFSNTFIFPSQLGGLPVPWLPWLPICPWNGAIQALERLGSPPAPDPVHPQGERHADAPQGLLRDDRLGRPDRVQTRQTGKGQACTAANHPLEIHEQPLSHTS